MARRKLCHLYYTSKPKLNISGGGGGLGGGSLGGRSSDGGDLKSDRVLHQSRRSIITTTIAL